MKSIFLSILMFLFTLNVYADVESVTTIVDEGGRVAVSHDKTGIFYDTRGDDGYYDVWYVELDGSNKKCLSCNREEITNGHVGNPTPHPTKNYIVFQAVNTELIVLPPILQPNAIQHTSPGAAINNNLWCMNLNTGKLWRLTNVPSGYGTLHPHFSSDGTKLLWSEKIGFTGGAMGEWSIKIANFNLNYGIPSLSNMREYKPGYQQFYETHGFMNNDTAITFSAFKWSDDSQTLDCFKYNLITKRLVNLTNTPLDWEEFATISPDGKQITLISTKRTKQARNSDGSLIKGKWKTDLWSLNLATDREERLSNFNVVGYPEYDPRGVVVADFEWLDNERIVAKVRIQSDNIMSLESVRIIKLKSIKPWWIKLFFWL